MLALCGDYAFRSALVVFLLAMVAFGWELAARHRLTVQEPALVGGRAADVGPPLQERDADPAAPAAVARADRVGRMAVALTILGAALLAFALAARGLAAQRWPWGNMYEFTAALCLTAVVAWLVALRRSPALRRIGLFVLVPVVVLMFLAGTVLYTEAAPLVPALQSFWIAIHVSTIGISSGLLLVAGVASALFLYRRSDLLDRLAYRITIVAFPLYTFAVITGAIWAEAAWGRFWGWDPKETVAFVAWVVYAAYLHARATAGWRARRAAWINVAGLAVIVFNLFFINLVTAGLHSYAGVG